MPYHLKDISLRFTGFFLFLFAGATSLYAGSPVAGRDSVLRLSFYFLHDDTVLYHYYHGNPSTLFLLDSLLLSPSVRGRIDSIHIAGYTSAMGSASYNDRLSALRADATRGYLLRRYPDFDPGRVHASAGGIAWQYAALLVESDPLAPGRVELLAILNGDFPPARKLFLLGRINDADIQRYLTYFLYPALRRSTLQVKLSVDAPAPLPEACDLLPEAPALLTEAHVSLPEAHVLSVGDLYGVAPVRRAASSPFFLLVKSNLLYDAALLPNLSVEVALSRSWSASLYGYYSSWDTQAPRYWSHRISWVGAELRHWRNGEQTALLTGLFFGAYVSGGNYDLRLFPAKLTDSGYLSPLSYSAGLTGGYSWRLGVRWRLEASLGVGYLGGVYHRYGVSSSSSERYPYTGSGSRNYVGPTRAALTLVYRLGNTE
jgi:hypothetical protein